MKNFIEEFKKFIMRGNVLDMAVGVIIGGAFGKITASLVNDVLMPFISFVCGSTSMNALNITVRPEVLDEAGEVAQEAITLGFGTFIGTVIDFVLVAFVIFCIVKAFNKARELTEKKEEEPAPAPEEPKKPTTEELLTDILAELKNK